MRGKTALVTGSTSGMGKAIVDRLARAGANVVVHGLADDAQLQVRMRKTTKKLLI